jgi:hypothetical protein
MAALALYSLQKLTTLRGLFRVHTDIVIVAVFVGA